MFEDSFCGVIGFSFWFEIKKMGTPITVGGSIGKERKIRVLRPEIVTIAPETLKYIHHSAPISELYKMV